MELYRVITLPPPTRESPLGAPVGTKNRKVRDLVTERWCQELLGTPGSKEEGTESRETTNPDPEPESLVEGKSSVHKSRIVPTTDSLGV